jgi:hypothetical protein
MIQEEKGIDIDQDYVNTRKKTFILKNLIIFDDFGGSIRN